MSPQTKDALPLQERLSLLNKLEMAKAKVQTLEAQVKEQKNHMCTCFIVLMSHWSGCLALYLHVLQLEENSKSWGRQKQEMLTKLSEHRHGFVRTSTTILHNIPLVSWVQLAFVLYDTHRAVWDYFIWHGVVSASYRGLCHSYCISRADRGSRSL